MTSLHVLLYAFLIATANAKSTTPGTDMDYNDDYYDDKPELHTQDDQNSEDSSLRPKFLTNSKTVTAKIGETVILDCPTENADNYVLIWEKDKTPISQGKVVYNADLHKLLGNYSLIVKRANSYSGGYYSCVIVITKTDNISLTHRLKIENAAEIVSLRAKDDKTQLLAGEALELTCEVNGKPIPNIKWYFNEYGQGSVPIPNNNPPTSEKSDTLVIKSVDLKNNGTYRCLADNRESVDHKTIDIQVFVKPFMRIEKMYSKSKTLTGLNCLVKANPVANVMWKKNKEILSIHYTKSLKLYFDNVNESNFGIYICKADNFIGSAEKYAIFERPLQPQFDEFSSVENVKRVVLTWTVKSHEPIFYCAVYYKRENETRQFVAETELDRRTNYYVVTHRPFVPYDGTYGFKVKCLSEAGWSDESQEKSIGIRGFRDDAPVSLKEENEKAPAAKSDSRTSDSTHLFPSIALFITTILLLRP